MPFSTEGEFLSKLKKTLFFKFFSFTKDDMSKWEFMTHKTLLYHQPSKRWKKSRWALIFSLCGKSLIQFGLNTDFQLFVHYLAQQHSHFLNTCQSQFLWLVLLYTAQINQVKFLMKPSCRLNVIDCDFDEEWNVQSSGCYQDKKKGCFLFLISFF